MNLSKLHKQLALAICCGSIIAMPYTVAAADPQNPTTTVTQDGTYNSITVNNTSRDADDKVYGIKGSTQQPAITMTGDRHIIVTDDLIGSGSSYDAESIGVQDAHISLGGGTLRLDSTAKGQTGDNNQDAHAAASGLVAITHGNTIDGNLILQIHAQGGITGANQNAIANATGIVADSSNNIINGNIDITATAQSGQGNTNYSYAMALVSEQGNNTINGNATIRATALSNGLALAVGMQTGRAGYTNTITGDVYISVDATTDSGQIFQAISMFAGDSTNDLSSGGTVKQLEGDLFTGGTDAHNILNMDTANSYLQGNIITFYDNGTYMGKNTVSISNGATWRPVYDNRYGSFNDPSGGGLYDKDYTVDDVEVLEITLKDQGIVDLTWDGWQGGVYDKRNSYRTLTIDKLNGSGGIIRLDTDIANNTGDKVTINAADSGSTLGIMVNYDPFYDLINPTISGTVAVVDGTAANGINVIGVESEYNDKVYQPNVELNSGSNEWEITSIDYVGTHKKNGSATTNVMTAADARLVLNKLWLVNTNDLSKRLGDLRSAAFDSTNPSGIWAKYGHGYDKNGAGRKAELQYNSFQIGYDRAQTVANGKIYRGITVSHVDGSTGYETGSGKANSTMFGLYQTWVGQSGHYYDVVLKTGRLAADYGMTDTSSNYSTANFSSWATTLSGEYGYRRNLHNGVYIEPQIELIAGHINGYDYTTSKGMHVTADSSKHLITRLGITLGKENKTGSVYAKANYYHDFAGSGGVRTAAVSYERSDRMTNWYELALGATFNTGYNSSIYLETNKYFGDLKSNLNFQVGARWSF